MTSDQPGSTESTVSVVAHRDGKHFAAGAVGLIALGFSARYTFGAVLIAPIGMAIAWWFARRSGRQLSATASWVAAIAATIVVLLAAVGVASTQLPAGSWSKIQHATDSAQAHPHPPPAWLERIAPGSTARAYSQQATSKETTGPGVVLFGGAILIGMLGGFLGTVGWLATMPLVYAMAGSLRFSPLRPNENHAAE